MFYLCKNCGSKMDKKQLYSYQVLKNILKVYFN
jgi:hypothetical protein